MLLLSKPETNFKISKNLKLNYNTYSLNHAHSDISGFNVCPMANKINDGENNPKKSNCSSVCVGYGSNLNITASENLTGYTAVNTSTLILSEWDSAAGTTGFTAADLSADGSIMISVTYMVH